MTDSSKFHEESTSDRSRVTSPPQAILFPWRTRVVSMALVVSLICMICLKVEIRSYRMAASDPTKTLSAVFSPGEQIAASLLGGFRSILVNILWVRILRHWERHQFLELPFLLQALEELQGSSPMLYHTQAHMMILDIPQIFSEGEERWHWITRGLSLLNRGLERFENNSLLIEEAGNLYFARFDPRSNPRDQEHFLKDQKLNPSQEDPLEIAEALLYRAQGLNDHRTQVDFILKKVQIYKVEKILKTGINTLNDESVRQEIREKLKNPQLRKSLGGVIQESFQLIQHVRKFHTKEQKHKLFQDLLRSWERELELFSEEFLPSQ